MHLSLVKSKIQSVSVEVLIPEEEWMSPDLHLYEGGDQLRLTLAGAIQYSGLGSIGGLVLGFRIIQRVVEITAGQSPMQRQGLSINTAFQGRGAKDAFEFTCRAITDYRYCCDATLHHPLAQPGPRGAYLFTVRANEQTLALTPVDGFPCSDYFTADRKSRDNETAALEWRNEKIKFANSLLRLTPEQCLRII